MKKVKNTIPVYDIPAIGGNDQLNRDIIAEPFASYLQAHPHLYAPHRHSFYHIVLFTKGAGFHTIDFQHFDVVPGQIYFMKPGQVHSWNFKGNVDGYVINFSEHLFHNFLINSHYLDSFRFLQGIADDCVALLKKETCKEVCSIIEKIVADVHGQQAQSPDFVRACLMELLIVVNRTFITGVADAIQPQNQLILANFRKLVDAHFREFRLPKDYAALLYITPNHLNALCSDLLGRSAGEVIRDRILLEAKRLLVNAGISMSEIAGMLNFTDNSHFSRFFKKNTALTPEEFRKKSFNS